MPGAGQGRDLRVLGGREQVRRYSARWKLDQERSGRKEEDLRVWEGRHDNFRWLVKMLNESMGLCLR